MARPESQAIAGYFPTPEHLVPAIASLVALERERYDREQQRQPDRGSNDADAQVPCGLRDADNGGGDGGDEEAVEAPAESHG